MPESAVSDALALGRLRADSAAWRLLAATNGPIVVALLTGHLGEPNARLDGATLERGLDADLDALRAEGIDMPRSARQYLGDWVRDRYISRRPATDGGAEVYELTSDTLAAREFLDQLRSPAPRVTSARIETLTAVMGRLAIAANSSPNLRLQALTDARVRLEGSIDAVRSGDYDPLEPDDVTRTVDEVLLLARPIATDAARQRERLAAAARRLNGEVTSATPEREVIEDVLRGVDLVAESPAGTEAAALRRAVTDPGRAARLRADVESVLDTEAAAGLDADRRRRLRGMLPALQRAAADLTEQVDESASSARRPT